MLRASGPRAADIPMTRGSDQGQQGLHLIGSQEVSLGLAVEGTRTSQSEHCHPALSPDNRGTCDGDRRPHDHYHDNDRGQDHASVYMRSLRSGHREGRVPTLQSVPRAAVAALLAAAPVPHGRQRPSGRFRRPGARRGRLGASRPSTNELICAQTSSCHSKSSRASPGRTGPTILGRPARWRAPRFRRVPGPSRGSAAESSSTSPPAEHPSFLTSGPLTSGTFRRLADGGDRRHGGRRGFMSPGCPPSHKVSRFLPFLGASPIVGASPPAINGLPESRAPAWVW
jgi:hypothetical protein